MWGPSVEWRLLSKQMVQLLFLNSCYDCPNYSWHDPSQRPYCNPSRSHKRHNIPSNHVKNPFVCDTEFHRHSKSLTSAQSVCLQGLRGLSAGTYLDYVLNNIVSKDKAVAACLRTTVAWLSCGCAGWRASERAGCLFKNLGSSVGYSYERSNVRWRPGRTGCRSRAGVSALPAC